MVGDTTAPRLLLGQRRRPSTDRGLVVLDENVGGMQRLAQEDGKGVQHPYPSMVIAGPLGCGAYQS